MVVSDVSVFGGCTVASVHYLSEDCLAKNVPCEVVIDCVLCDSFAALVEHWVMPWSSICGVE